MKKSELIKALEAIEGDPVIMILDGFNGGGEPRDINLGPSEREITDQNAADGADCEGRQGESVVVMGYGCY